MGFMNSCLFFSYASAYSVLSTRSIFNNEGSIVFWSGFIGGILPAMVNSPSELIKCRAQVNLKSEGKLIEEYHIFRDLLKRKELGRGLAITIIRDLPSYASYFYSYYIFNKLTENSIIAGGFAGMVAWGIVYPLDVVKTVYQTSNQKSYATVIKTLYATGGSRVFFKGFGATMLKAWPQNAAVFYSYNLVFGAFSKSSKF